MDQIVQFVDPLKQFAKDSVRLVKRCTKPDKKGKKKFPQKKTNFSFHKNSSYVTSYNN